MIANNQCECTVMAGAKEPVQADVFCPLCNGSGKLDKPVVSLYERLTAYKHGKGYYDCRL